MKLAIYRTSRLAFKKAGAAVSKNGGNCSGFTLLELMVVVVIIGILATLGYSSLTDIIFTSRAKETAQTMRTFAEKTLMDAKRQNIVVKITLSSNAIIATDTTAKKEVARAALGSGYNPTSSSTYKINSLDILNTTGMISNNLLGLSSISAANGGCLVACGAKGYCGGVEKKATENSFKAYIRRGTSASWEAL